MTYRLFIDDERFPVDDNWEIVRTSADAIAMMQDRGWPCYISFDHDLGGPDTTRSVVNWMIDQVLDGFYRGPMPQFFVHSQNPIGRDWIIKRMGDLETVLINTEWRLA